MPGHFNEVPSPPASGSATEPIYPNPSGAPQTYPVPPVPGGLSAGSTGPLPGVDLGPIVEIDGLTQPGSAPNQLATGFNATNLVTLDGLNREFSPALRALPPLAWSYARRAGAHFEAGFETLAGLGYSVLYNDDLNTANWLVLTNLTGSGGLMPLVLPTEGVPHRFFRLRHP